MADDRGFAAGKQSAAAILGDRVAGGQAAARHILDRPALVAGKRIVDFAAGSGIAGIAAMMAGAAQVTAVDIDPFARVAMPLNAALNKVMLDVAGAQDLTRVPAVDLILAGDICYEQTMSARLLRWLRICVDRGIEVWLADPGRAYLPTEGLTKLGGYDVPTSRDIEDREMRHATIWRLEKAVD